eukprot:CAMPEP_0195517936 /NCGR_PEP_ID=MMETSP0794_2-20130614/11832_1 /TAXON_ID=515487 /ORGANISM="Stephanopyxis turris, Strain CCMP 815" /LENGTH=266 /DNA_ID=CAMNT_0040646819 /DNA_START=12 /DNA_END=812 /DNA_ORIENTATION=+
MRSLGKTVLVLAVVKDTVKFSESFSASSSTLAFRSGASSICRSSSRTASLHAVVNDDSQESKNQNGMRPLLLASAIAFSQLGAFAQPCEAYEANDYASETVTAAVKTLDAAAGNLANSFAAYEEVAKIITEGKGVGGEVSYGGVNLERGLVADEDTTIYNPGLTLLTESEKERLVEAVIRNRKEGITKGAWSEDNQFGFEFLKQKLDPYYTVELKGYYSIFPFWGAAVYLAALAVQQNARQFFSVAYILGAVLVFAPALALIALGP